MVPSDNAAAFAPLHGKILLAEDDHELRQLIATVLRDSGCEVVEARDGNDLMERLAETLPPNPALQAFDLIVSDIQMPTFSALDVLVGAHLLLGKAARRLRYGSDQVGSRCCEPGAGERPFSQALEQDPGFESPTS